MFRSLSLLLVGCHGNQKEGIWPKMAKKCEKTFFEDSHIQLLTNFDYDLYMLKQYSLKGVD